MKIIGITGTSGSGKTTLSEILSNRKDSIIINADKIARMLNKPGTEYMKEIENSFGKEFIFGDGNLNRKKMADLIYSNEEARKKLNSLSFRYIDKEIKKIIEEAKSETKYIFIDAPLLFEAGIDKYCDIVIALIANEELKIERICKRDGIDAYTASKRLKIQHDDIYYTEKADYVIENTKDYNLEKRINDILEEVSH